MSYDPASFPDFFASGDPTAWFDAPATNDDIWSSLGVTNPPTSSTNLPPASLAAFNNPSFNAGLPPAPYLPPSSAPAIHKPNTSTSTTNNTNDLQHFFASHNFPGLPFAFGDAGFGPSSPAGLASPASNSNLNTTSPAAAAALVSGIVPQPHLARSQSGSNISDSGGSPDSSSQSEAGVTPANKKDKDPPANKTASQASAAAGGTNARARKTSTAKKVTGKKASTDKADKEKEKEKTKAASDKAEKEKEKVVGEKRKEPTEGRSAPGSVKDRRSSKSAKSGGGATPSVTTASSARGVADDDYSHSHPNEDSGGEEDDDDLSSNGRIRTTDRRKEQNRNAQRAFRERKERHMKELEDRVDLLENTTKEQSTENQNLRDLVERLRRENERLTVYETAFQFSFNREYVQPGNMPLASSFQGSKDPGVAAAAAAARKGSPASRAGSGSGASASASGSPAPSVNGAASSSGSSPAENIPETPSANKNPAYTQHRDVVDDMWAGKKGASPITGPKQGAGAGTDGGKKFEVDINGLCAEMEAKASCQEAARKALEEALIQDQHLALIFKNSK